MAAGRLECLRLAGLGSPPEGVLSASRCYKQGCWDLKSGVDVGDG